VIGIRTGVMIEIIKINPTGTEVEIVLEIGVKKDEGIKALNVIEIEVMIVTKIKVMTVIKIEIDMTIVILEEVEAEMDREKKNMKKSMVSFFYIFIFDSHSKKCILTIITFFVLYSLFNCL